MLLKRHFSKFFLFVFFLSIRTLFAQNSSPIQIGPKKISSERFLSDYRRLIESDSVRAENKEKFLKDYIDYHYKILAAELAKIPESPGFQEEYQSFRKELASPYLIENEKVDELVKEAYSRLKDEKQVAHILVKLPSNPSPGDTLIAYQKIENIYKKLKLGEDFSTMALKYSEDDQSAQKGGNLGYLTSLQTQYALENTFYSLGLGEYSKPIRTKTGYHIIKLLKQRPNQGKIRLAHILVSVAVNANTNLQVDAKKKIEQVEAYLTAGESFETVCKNYSEDPYSIGRGGELRRWYYSSDLSEELQDKLFGLQRLGDVSKPIRTNLGWQIFKLLDKKPLLTYDEMSEYLRQKIMTDPDRSNLIHTAFMKRVRKENNLLIDEQNKKIAIERFNIDRVGDEPFLKFNLFSISDKNFTIQDFYSFIVSQQKRKLKELGYLPTISEAEWLDDFIDQNTLKLEEQQLEKKYPAFKEQMQEFFEGSLYSKITENMIFEPSLDSLKQANYYKENASLFVLPNRVYAKYINADSPKTLSDALDLLKSAPYPMNKRYPDVNFKLGTSTLSDNAAKLISELQLLMLKNKDYVLEVSGHIDASEADSLVTNRMDKVVKEIAKKGILSPRFIEKEEGKLSPISKTDKSKNARVSFKFYSESMDDVVKRFNSIKPNSLEAQEKYFLKGENTYIDALGGQISRKTLEENGRNVYVEIIKSEPERIKSFDESRSTIIRNLQVKLEKEWLENLKNTNPVIIQQEELQKLMQ
ncbi:peptidylprolyl isomerase [Aquirufa sp. ROCK-SH2]